MKEDATLKELQTTQLTPEQVRQINAKIARLLSILQKEVSERENKRNS